MIYDGELRLLCETFKKSRIQATVITDYDDIEKVLDHNFKLLFMGNKNLLEDIGLDAVKNKTVYRVSNDFGLCCVILRLPDTSTGSVLIIGPFLREEPNKQKLLEAGEKHNASPQQLKLLERFYENVTPLLQSSHLFVMLDAFAERIWGSEYEIIDLDSQYSTSASVNIPLSYSDDDTLINMKLMEERYAAENEMINAVASGQVHKGNRLLADFAAMPFEKRLDDPLRNLKNYSIIMNTLLRKAAEQGGVHPLYIDEMSSSFAQKIEQVLSLKHLQDLMSNMYTSYCTLVQQHTTKNLSSPVRTAILTIDRDISSNLTLSSLAAAQNINASYLSALFKRETGKTVTEYVNGKKMHLAARLLRTTSLQIQTVALHCGIMDVQYFSKLFKKHIGDTPKEYREKSKKKSLS